MTNNARISTEDLSRGAAFERDVMPPEQLPLVVTEGAVRRIHVLQEKESKPGASLRLRIIAGGCSGMQYRMDLADAPRPTDLVVAQQDAKVFVDPKTMPDLRGPRLNRAENRFG